MHGPGIDEPLARIDGGRTAAAYYHADGLGSILKTTDGAGNAVHAYRITTPGEPSRPGAEPGYAFTGREWDPETGLYYYRARYYDPKVGRFISEDPIGFEGGVNFYAYVENNPANAIDPLGLQGYGFYNTPANESASRINSNIPGPGPASPWQASWWAALWFSAA